MTVTDSSSAPTRRSRVDRHGEVRRQLEAFVPEGVEAGQREDDGVGAGSKIDDAVAALAVGDDRADLFDEDRTAGFDRHARHHRAARVADQSADGALGAGDRRRQQEEVDAANPPRTSGSTRRDTVHRLSPLRDG